MAVNIMTLLLGFTAFTVYDRWELRGTMIDQTATIADVLAYNCTAALLFNDSADAQETLSFLKTKPSIRCRMDFLGKRGSAGPYIQEEPGKRKTQPPVRKNGSFFKERMLHLYKEVSLYETSIGTVYIQSDMREMNQIAKDHFLIAVLGFLFSILITFLLSMRLQKTIGAPIAELASLSRAVSKEKDYTVRARKHGNDEIGSLVDAFNEMLRQIEQQNASLMQTGKNAEESAREALRLAKRVTQTNLELEKEITIRKDVEKTLQKHRENLEMLDFGENLRIAQHQSTSQEGDRRKVGGGKKNSGLPGRKSAAVG
jgi:methyl-accepting chemotaxis protein